MNTTTKRMLKALELVVAGQTAYAAARATGITPQAIYRHPRYIELLASPGGEKLLERRAKYRLRRKK